MITIKVERAPQRGTGWITAPSAGMETGEAAAVARHWARDVEPIGYLDDVRAIAKRVAMELVREGYRVRYLDETPGWEADGK